MPHVTKSNPNIFMSHQPPPQPQQQQQPFVPPIHLFNQPGYPPQRMPAYGKINLLRYGYSANQKPRSESRLFDKDIIDNKVKQQQQQQQYQYQQYQQQQQQQQTKSKRKKYKIPSVQPSIYSFNHLNQTKRTFTSNHKFMQTSELAKDKSCVISVSISSSKFDTNRFPVKPKGVTKVYKEHAKVHFDTLRGCKNAANVLKPDVYEKHVKLSFVKNQQQQEQQHTPTKEAIIEDFLKHYMHQPTYFQPGFYPTNSYPDLNLKGRKMNLFF
jgi:hypothetical protein